MSLYYANVSRPHSSQMQTRSLRLRNPGQFIGVCCFLTADGRRRTRIQIPRLEKLSPRHHSAALNWRRESLPSLVTCHSSPRFTRPPVARAPCVEHESHPRQTHDAGKSHPIFAAPAGLPLPSACPNPRNREKRRTRETGWPQKGTKRAKNFFLRLDRGEEKK